MVTTTRVQVKHASGEREELPVTQAPEKPPGSYLLDTPYTVREGDLLFVIVTHDGVEEWCRIWPVRTGDVINTAQGRPSGRGDEAA